MKRLTLPLYVICVISFYIGAIIYITGGNTKSGILSLITGTCFLIALIRLIRSENNRNQ